MKDEKGSSVAVDMNTGLPTKISRTGQIDSESGAGFGDMKIA